MSTTRSYRFSAGLAVKRASVFLLTLSLILAANVPGARAVIPATSDGDAHRGATGRAVDKNAQAEGLIFVKASATGANNGASWSDAYVSLQAALSAAGSGDQIWVAAGTYKPSDTGDRSATFQLKSGVAIYGGFAGNEISLEQRDWTRNAVRLNGDLNDDDFVNFEDNSYHVVTGASGAILDGVTISSGNANGSAPDNSGGGMYNDGSSPALSNVIFESNRASDSGGGMYNVNSSPILTNVYFGGNMASVSGGGLENANHGSPVLTNVTFSANEAPVSGGGMENIDNSSPILTNVSFNNNKAGQGAGMHNGNNSSPTVRNSILWGDGGGEIANDSSSTTTVSYSDVQGGYPGTGNIDADPLFFAPYPRLPYIGGDLHLRAGSPAIDAGDNSVVTLPIDGDGHQRIIGSAVDLGAYEWRKIYVDAGATGANDGTSWTDAYASLQDALKAGSTGHLIWVAAGTYRPSITGERSASFRLPPGAAIYGGFAGGETSLDQRDWITNAVILSGDLNGDDVGFTNNGENSYHVVIAATAASLDGVMIRGGNANDGGLDCVGGGMYNASQDGPRLANVTFSGNTARYYGGGMYNGLYSYALLSNVTFSDNTAQHGGGMYNDQVHSVLTNVTFSGNRAGNGGGMYNFYSDPVLTNATFSANTASNEGGGMYNYSSGPTLANVTFRDNGAGSGGGMWNYSALWGSGPVPALNNVTFYSNHAELGGGIYNFSSSPALANVTFSGNTATNGGGMYSYSIWTYGDSRPVLTNVTFYGNTAQNGGGIYNETVSGRYSAATHTSVRNSLLWSDSGGEIDNSVGSSTTASSSIVQGGYPGTGNLDADPLLAPLGDYGGGVQTMALLPGSPAIDAASSSCPGTDARGVARSTPNCDLGAFESQGFALVKTSGDGQSAPIHFSFTQPLCVALAANGEGEPVDGGKVVFTSPANGASAILTGNPATIASGAACANARANGTAGGPYSVTASGAGAASVTFSLTNEPATVTYLPSLLK